MYFSLDIGMRIYNLIIFEKKTHRSFTVPKKHDL